MEALVPAAIEGGNGIFNCLKRKYDYVKKIERNFKNLEKEGKNLLDVYDDVKKELENNKSTEEMTRSCETWLNDVENTTMEIQNLEDDCNMTRTYLCGLCPFPQLLKLGKRIVRTTGKVVELKDQIAQIKKTVKKSPAPPVPFIKKHARNLSDIPSLDSHVEKLLEWLQTMELKRICIWGPPGVGKTTIMENLHDRVGSSREFDMIFWVTVRAHRAEDIIGEILDVIWKRLDMEMDGRHDRDQKAGKISEVLQDKKYVLFLDLNDICSEINLREAGIHDEHKHGKVVFSSRCRSNNICGQTDEEINMQRLSDKDAANFFWNVVGASLKSNRDIRPFAERIIKECGGMPFLIKLIGNSLASVNETAIWKDMLEQLTSPIMEPHENLVEIYKAFKAVYDKLPEDRKPCLLYWAVFPVGYEVSRDHIIDCWRAEQFLSTLGNLPKARDRGHTILDEFVKKSLLEKGRNLGHFKMYEYFQRAALRMDKTNSNFFVTGDENIKEVEWEKARRVSLIGVDVSNLPERPHCGGILSLLIQEPITPEPITREPITTKFPSKFFGCMNRLQVLNLHETRIAALPSSISSLQNLKGLFLNKSGQLLHLPSEIGDLQSLEILDILGLYSLPIEIGKLANLKCLRVSFTEDGGNHNHVEETKPMIPSNVIVKLSKLEELSIGVRHNSIRYQNVADIAKEISGLEVLTTLCFFFPEMPSFQFFIQNSKSWRRNEAPGNRFRSFSIVVGPQQNNATEFNAFECSAKKHLNFSAGSEFPRDISQVLKQAKAFELIGHQTATSLSAFGADNLQGLEACIIKECNEMKSIIDRTVVAVRDCQSSGVEFEQLKSLYLNSLPKLEEIWRGSIEIKSKSLCGLTTLTLKGCGGIRTLFPQSMIIVQLSKLQKLVVEDCGTMEAIIGKESGDVSEAFPKLKKLRLYDLPQLDSISPVTLKWPFLEKISIKTCVKIKKLYEIMENASKLRKIKCTEDWWRLQDWPNDDVKDHFRKLLNLPHIQATTMTPTAVDSN